jgi:hypothetical protein
MASKTAQVRASGLTQAEEIVAEEMKKIDVDPATEDPGEERTIKFRTPGFSRMRVEWRGDDLVIVRQVQNVVEDRLIHAFRDAYALLHELYDLVRTPEIVNGQIVKDRHGFTIWKRNPITGSFEEDWSKLTVKEKENLLFGLTTRIFGWEQRAAELWSEAMLAKAQYEERFSIAYDEPKVGTIDDRIAVGKKDAAEERYFAILMATLSRRADALVRSLSLLGQRVKDTLPS